MSDTIRLVSLDVDGTLYSLPRMRWHGTLMLMRAILSSRRGAARTELRALKRSVALIEAARLTGGALEPALQAACLDEHWLAIERRWFESAIARTGPRPGVRECLDHLAARKIPVVAVSDYVAEYKLVALGVRGRFAGIYEGVRLGYVKPNPRALEQVAADFGVPASAILHIGDRPDTDGAAARNAGCQWRMAGADARVFLDLTRELS